MFATGTPNGNGDARPRAALGRWTLTALALGFLLLVLVLPLAAIVSQALAGGLRAYAAAVGDPETLAAIRLTLLAAVVAVPLNLVCGILAAWAVARFEFPGKSVLVTLIDVPLAVSPVIAGFVYVLIFGRQGWLGDWLDRNGIQVLYAFPGIALATAFVTFPFVARELIPLMEAQGRDEEEAARLLGAKGVQIFLRVTLPNVKWGLLYGGILSTARAFGEFGAVSVVSGHIRGKTTTMTQQVEILYNEYNFVGAFAVASLLSLMALVTLIAKSAVEWRFRGNASGPRQSGPAQPGGRWP